MEQGIGRGRIEVVVETQVILFLQFARLARPSRMRIVDNQILIGVLVFAVLPFLFLAANDFHRQETAVFLQQVLDLFFAGKFLVLLGQMQHHIRAPLGLAAFFHLVIRRAFAAPMHRFGPFLVGTAEDFHLAADHESRIEA